MLRLRVECYAGHRAEETPRRFYLGQRCVEADEVVDRWLSPDRRYFKIIGDDRATYILQHDTATDQWTLVLYERGGGE